MITLVGKPAHRSFATFAASALRALPSRLTDYLQFGAVAVRVRYVRAFLALYREEDIRITVTPKAVILSVDLPGHRARMVLYGQQPEKPGRVHPVRAVPTGVTRHAARPLPEPVAYEQAALF